MALLSPSLTSRHSSSQPAAWPALFILLFLLFAVGCSRDQETTGSHPIQSKLFQRVEVFGKRGAGPGEFNKPRSVAVDREDNFYVVDFTGRVQKFSPDGRFLLFWQMPETTLGKAKGMGRDPQGNILVVEPHYQRVNHYSTDGNVLAQWGVRGTNAGQFMLPRSIATTTRGDYWVSEYTLRERVQCFSGTDHHLLKNIGRAGIAPGEFNRPEGIGLDAQDRLYVADSCNHRIQVFSPDGAFLRAYGKAGSGPGEFSYPYDIRVDELGHQYVCEFGNSRVQVFDAQDRLIEVIGKAGGAPAQFNNPWAIALDSHGNLYVADGENHRVQKFIRR